MTFDPTKFVPAQRAVSLLDEFKKFAFKGNLIDLAVAVVVGTAFTKLVDSFVKNVVMDLVTGIINLLGGGTGDGAGYTTWTILIGPGQHVHVGAFFGELLNFTLVAFVVYLSMVKLLGWIIRRREAEPPKPTREQELLAEIRDLLRQQVGGTPKITEGAG